MKPFKVRILLFAIAAGISVVVCSAVVGQTVTYTYDSVNRITQVQYGNGSTINYTYDAAGNRLTQTVNVVNPSFLLTVTDPANGAVTGTGINCPGDCTESYVTGTSVLLTAAPANGYQVDTWTGCQSVNGNECTVQMTQARDVSVTFKPITYLLTLSPVPTNGYVSATGISCGAGGTGDCSEAYNSGTNVTLTGNPSGGYQVGTWTGCTPINNNTQCTVQMTQDRTVSGTFTPIVIADTTAPSLLITSHTNLQTVTSTPITLSGTASDAGLGNNGISYVTVNGTAAGNGTAVGSGTANWSQSVSLNLGNNAITVLAKDDSSNQNTTTVQITINYQPLPSVSINDVSVAEGNAGTTNAVFTVPLSSFSSQIVTATYSTANGTATAGNDYVAKSGTLTFNPGDTTKTITVVVNGDTVVEPDETFFVNLTTATNASIADGQGAGTILNDDSCIFLGTPLVDFDGDCKSDIGVYQTSSGNWFFVQSTAGFDQQLSFGGSSFHPVPKDYDGDGVSDTAVYQTTTGNWFIDQSTAGFKSHPSFGGAGFIPVPGDYDGDGKTDIAVYQQSTGNWFFVGSTSGFGSHLSFGGTGFIPVPGDYDGDGETDVAVYQQSTGHWFFVGSTSGFGQHLSFGGSGFIPMPGDYDGDGRSDPGVYQSSTGNWFFVGSTSGFGSHLNFGGSGFVPVAGDYDGDGKTDPAVYQQSTGNWFVVGSTTGFFSPALSFGGAGFVPVLPQVTILRALGLL